MRSSQRGFSGIGFSLVERFLAAQSREIASLRPGAARSWLPVPGTGGGRPDAGLVMFGDPNDTNYRCVTRLGGSRRHALVAANRCDDSRRPASAEAVAVAVLSVVLIAGCVTVHPSGLR